MLTSPFTKEEFHVALFSMHSSFENIIMDGSEGFYVQWDGLD